MNIEISFLVSECHGLEYELLEAGEKGKGSQEQEAMMKNHAVKAGVLEKTLPLQVELECLYSHTEELKSRSTYVSTMVA